VRRSPALSLVAGVLLGTGYGLLARWVLSESPATTATKYAFSGVSIAFLFLVPYALGLLTAALGPGSTTCSCPVRRSAS
jgi:hypothetical protein